MFHEKQYLSQLRKATANSLGREITRFPDCVALSERLQEQGHSITPQTLRRFFGLINYGGGFNIFTLDALAQFCGFENYCAFRKSLGENEMEIFFKDAGHTYIPQDFWKASERLCTKLTESSSLLAKTHLQLLKYPRARQFFLEHHPMRDLSCTVYAQYFQEYLKYNTTNEAKLFAYGFLFMGAFLSENEEFLEIYFSKVEKTELTEEVYVLPAARKFGVALLYHWIQKDELRFQKTYKEMLKACELYREASEKSVCSFEYTVLEHLIFTDKVDEMKFLIENKTSQKYSDKSFVSLERKENHEEVWKIMCAVAFAKMKDVKKCEHYLHAINITKLSVGWKNYYTILYYRLKYDLSEAEERQEINKILKELISKTHFTYYEQFLKN